MAKGGLVLCTFIASLEILTFVLMVKNSISKHIISMGQNQTGGAISDTHRSTLKQHRSNEKIWLFRGLTKPNIRPKNYENICIFVASRGTCLILPHQEKMTKSECLILPNISKGTLSDFAPLSDFAQPFNYMQKFFKWES